MQFSSTEAYIAPPDLAVAVNAAITLERPLLVKGEPGTGKTELARQVAASLGLPILEWNVKSTTRAQQGLYEYDAVSRLRDSQLGEARVHDIGAPRFLTACAVLWPVRRLEEHMTCLGRVWRVGFAGFTGGGLRRLSALGG